MALTPPPLPRHRTLPASPTPDLLVVGGGIIGLAVAREAALRGFRVRVLDAGTPGGGATRAAAGMLSPLAEAGEAGPFLEAGLASLALYPGWIEALRVSALMDPWYRADGKVKVGFGEAGTEALRALARRAGTAGLEARFLTREEATSLLGTPPSPEARALFLPADHQVDNRRLLRLLLDATRAAGVQVDGQAPVRRVEPAPGGGGAPGVRLADGSRLPGGTVLVAAGAWTGVLLPGLPVTPVGGQMLVMEGGAALPRRVVASPDVYLVPRRDGRLLVGATVEPHDSPFQAARGRCTPVIRARLVAAARHILPALGTRVLDHWYGVRPGSPDGNPLLGSLPDAPGIQVATGHFRNGILLAPWTAQALGRLLAGGPGPTIPPAFEAGRLASQASFGGS
jgi:glycine oxidase